jgi:hypothetical protein
VLEIGVVHALVSWPVLRWTLFVIGVYGLLGFIAFHFSMCQHPHPLPRKEVDRAHKNNVDLDGDDLALSFMGETNVELTFSPAAEVEMDGRTRRHHGGVLRRSPPGDGGAAEDAAQRLARGSAPGPGARALSSPAASRGPST